MSNENRDSATDGDAVFIAMARAMAGEGTPDEREAFRRELGADPRRGELFAALGGALRPLSATPAAADVDVEAALARVVSRRDARPVLVAGAPARPPRVVPPSTARPARWQGAGLLRLAAGFLLLLGGALVWRTLAPRLAGPSVSGERYSTGVRTQRTVQLPDGSVVQLAPLSAIEVLSTYGKPERAVKLEGQAYFDVQHDAAHPFVVRTATAEVRDLGTTFSVTADGRAGARVVVTSGSVSLRAQAGRETVVLRAGDRGSVGAAGEPRAERGIATDDDVAWTQGRLVFRDAPVPQVAAELRRWYGITLVVRDAELSRRHLTASFGTETADEAVRVVAAALGGELQRRGDTAAVVPSGAERP
jgi:transmembrane sensor